MPCGPTRRCFTLVELFVIILICVALVCMFVPAVNNAREAARRASCISNLKHLGMAMWNYHDKWGSFPPSSTQTSLSATAPLPGSPEAGYSWRALILPYLEEQPLYKQLDPTTGSPYDGSPKRLAVASIPTFASQCPSFVGPVLAEAPEYAVNTTALTNYVALGATHLASLYRTETRPIGGPSHPNGTLYPGSATTLRDLIDGSSNTFMVCETREVEYAAWVDGTTAAVVGLAEQPSPTFDFQKVREDLAYHVPADGVLTTLNYGQDDPAAGEFYLPTGRHSGRSPWTRGPSSSHPSIVNHSFGDGSVKSISDRIDPGLYMHAITRAGGEPPNELHGY